MTINIRLKQATVNSFLLHLQYPNLIKRFLLLIDTEYFLCQINKYRDDCFPIITHIMSNGNLYGMNETFHKQYQHALVHRMTLKRIIE